MRLIDADDARGEMIAMLRDCFDATDEVVDSVATTINNMPTIDPEPHWIPVTERPDKSGDYLATLIDGAEKWVEIIYWNETFGGSWQAVIGDEECYSIIGNVIAWMPLPEPYKGVTE